MNQITTKNNEPFSSGVGEGSSKIAAAIMTYQEKPCVAFCWTVRSALAAGLRRHSIPVVEVAPIYNNAFIVTVLTVPSAQRSEALTAVKQTLNELDLIADAVIAMDRAGESWIVLHGIGTGGIKFEDGFLRPEVLAASMAMLQKHSQEKQVFLETMLNDLLRRVAEGKNSE